MLNLLKEGTTSLSSIQIAEAQERLGATISTSGSVDRTAVSLTAATPNLRPSLDILADVIRNPAFSPSELERLRQQQLASIASEMTQPNIIARRVGETIGRLEYPATHGTVFYGWPGGPVPLPRTWNRL